MDRPQWTEPFAGLNALEIAVVVGAKKFIGQKPVQRIINGLWQGDIIFWDSLNVDGKKKPQVVNDRTIDPYCRLRVPKYQKAFEVLFIASFLALYYFVLVERDPSRITISEVLLYIWIAAFAYDEFGDFTDAGLLLYSMDFWSLWDLGIVCVGAAYLVTRTWQPDAVPLVVTGSPTDPTAGRLTGFNSSGLVTELR